MSANRRAVNLSALSGFQYTTTVDYSFWLMYNIPHLSQQVGPCGSACGAYLIDVQVEDITPTTGWLRSSLPLLIKAKTPRDKSLLLYDADLHNPRNPQAKLAGTFFKTLSVRHISSEKKSLLYSYGQIFPGQKFPSGEKLYRSYIVPDRNSPKPDKNSPKLDKIYLGIFVRGTFVL